MLYHEGDIYLFFFCIFVCVSKKVLRIYKILKCFHSLIHKLVWLVPSCRFWFVLVIQVSKVCCLLAVLLLCIVFSHCLFLFICLGIVGNGIIISIELSAVEPSEDPSGGRALGCLLQVSGPNVPPDGESSSSGLFCIVVIQCSIS